MGYSKSHAVIVSSPGIGHLVPVLELGKNLVTHHNFKITVIVINTNPQPQSIVPAADLKLLDVVEIPAADVTALVEPDTSVLTRIVIMMRETVPAVRSAIAALETKPTVLVADLFGSELLKLGSEFGIPKYAFVPISAWSLSLALYCQVLDRETVGEYSDPVQVPGCRAIRPEDLVDPMMDREDQQYRDYIEMGVGFTRSDGILLNTWEDLDPRTLKAIKENLQDVVKVPVYPVGPLVRRANPSRPKSRLMDWLDEQQSDSVIYVSFGSGGTMSSKQIMELAWGLELSQCKFIWVVRRPVEKDSDGSFFTAGNGSGNMTRDFLPDGFLTRTHNRGLVVPQWAPQAEILSHPAVGGFMTHCGWNSTLESAVNGVPMIAWPLYAEQRLNAALLAEELGVAVRSKALPTKEVVEREEIEGMVRRVMEEREGDEMREKVKELMKSGERALRYGGSSYNSMCDMIKDCQMRFQSNYNKTI